MFAQGGPRNAEVTEWFTQISDLIENRPPAALQERFRGDRSLARHFDPAPTPARIVITLREDYLSHLERWKGVLPSLMRNRMGLHLLTGPQALEVAVRAGCRGAHPIVSEAVGGQIVRKVARRPESTPLEDIEAVLPFLSLLCEQLNAVRLAAGLDQITPELAAKHGDDILDVYYEESYRGQPAAVRSFVEDRLVSRSGHRNTVTHEDALSDLSAGGVANPAQAIDALIARRLLTTEERGGIPRLELTHDVLTPLVVRSRTARRQQEVLARQRQRFRRLVRVSVLFALFGVAMAGLLVYAWQQKERAKQAEGQASKDRDAAKNERDNAMEQTRKAEEATQIAEVARTNEYAQRLKAEEATQIAEIAATNEYAQRLVAESEKSKTLNALKTSTNSLAQAEKERARAEKAEQKALNQQAKVQGIVDYALFDLSEKLRPFGHADLLRDLTKQVLTLYGTATTNHDETAEDSIGRFTAYMNLGQALALQGEHTDALMAFQNGMDIAQEMSARRAGTNNWLAEICFCHQRIGDLLRVRGDSANALDQFQRSLDIAQRQAVKEPANKRWQDHLLQNYGRISEVFSYLGDTARARTNGLAAVHLAEGLANANPTNFDYQQTLLNRYTKAASMVLEELDTKQAEKWSVQSVKKAEQLATNNGRKPELQGDLAASLEIRGDVWLAQRKPGKALEQYEKSLKIRQSMAERDPNNLDYQGALLSTRLKIIPARAEQSEWSKILKYYRAALAAGRDLWKPPTVEQNKASQEVLKKARQLAEKDPGNQEWQHDLALSYAQCGEVVLHTGTNDTALGLFDEARRIRERLAESDPNATHPQYWLALSHVSLAAVLRRLSRHEEAASEARQALRIFGAMVSRWPRNILFLESPLIGKQNLSVLPPISQDQLKDAVNAFTRGFVRARKLATKDSATEKDIADYGSYCSELAVAYFFKRDLTKTLVEAGQAAAIWKKLSKAAAHDPSYRTNQIHALVTLGAFQIFNRQPKAAIETAQQGLALDSARVEFKAIRAIGCLLQDRFEEACAIIMENRELKVGLEQTFPEAVLDDLRRLRDNGLAVPDLEKLERRLASGSGKAP